MSWSGEVVNADKQQVLGGQSIFNEKEIEEMMNIYVQCDKEYGLEGDSLINLPYEERRKLRGEKLWEDMTIDERKSEFFNVLKMDLKCVSGQIVNTNRTHYISNRAQDPLDPMAGFYKHVLVKLGGATIAENGKIKLPLDLKERVENLDLYNKRIIELISAGGIEQFFKFKQDVADKAHVVELITNADRIKAILKGGIDIGRPGLYGNPSAFGTTRDTDVNTLVVKYREWLTGEKYNDVEPNRKKQILESILKGDLDGKGLVCYAHGGGTCHGEVLVDFIKDKSLVKRALKLPDQTINRESEINSPIRDDINLGINVQHHFVKPAAKKQSNYLTEGKTIAMNDNVFNDSYIVPAIVNGKIYLSDQEINFVMGSYALHGAGYDSKRRKTIGYHLVHRKTMGMKLWEEMNLAERKQEYFSQLRKDLEITWGQLDGKNKVDYLLDRALDPLDPMNNFYKMVLIKLGAKITDDGAIKLSADLKEKLENWELRHKRLIDLIPLRELELNRKLELRQSTPTLQLKPNYRKDF